MPERRFSILNNSKDSPEDGFECKCLPVYAGLFYSKFCQVTLLAFSFIKGQLLGYDY